MRLRFLPYVCFALLAGFAGTAMPAKAQMAVIENFVARTCSGSAPSNKHLHSLLENRTDALLLTCHLPDGGDETGPPVGMEECTDRMMKYVTQYTLRMAATPNIVINGKYQTIGTYEGIVKSGLALAVSENVVQPIALTITDNAIAAVLPELKQAGDYELWLYAYDKTVDITFQAPDFSKDDGVSEEIPMMSVTERYDNMVKAVKLLGPWEGAGESIEIPLHAIKAEGFALIAQEKGQGPIVASGKIETPGKTH